MRKKLSLSISNKNVYSVQNKLPIDTKIGPMALARAPIERNIPSTIPFWSCFPYSEMSVVMHVTTNAVAKID